MISDFISEEDGYLCLTDEEIVVCREKCTACIINQNWIVDGYICMQAL